MIRPQKSEFSSSVDYCYYTRTHASPLFLLTLNLYILKYTLLEKNAHAP